MDDLIGDPIKLGSLRKSSSYRGNFSRKKNFCEIYTPFPWKELPWGHGSRGE